MHLNQKKFSTTSIFPFLLLLTFCLFALILSGTGALVYKNSAAQLEENYTSRTAISYISEKVRQHNRIDSIILTELEQTPALRLQEVIENETYYTYLYFYQESLCELFLHAETTPSLSLGTRLIPLSALTFDRIPEEPLLSVTAVSPEGKELSVIIHCNLPK